MIMAAPEIESSLILKQVENVDLLELRIPIQDYTELCRAQGKILWSVDNAANEVKVLV